MSLQLAARHLASQGRGPDTELVHMGRGEVDALQEIARKHGGSLTINPQTGLAEAGFLSKLLPMVAGAGLSMMGVPPHIAAMMVGGGMGLVKGSLKKGLMAGLGAYGGASLGAHLGAAGVGSTAPAAGASGASGVTGASGAGVGDIAATDLAATAPPGMDGAAGQGLRFNAPADAYTKYSSLGANTGVSQVTPIASPEAMNAANVAKFEGLGSASDRFAAMQKGLSGENLMGFAKKHPFITGGTLLSMMPGEKKLKEEEEDTSMPEYSYNQGTDDSVFSSPDYQSNLASGKEMGYFKNRGFTKLAAAGGVMRGLNSASSNLGSYSDGGRLLRGPGDGVSDSIPAVIGKKQPARLADGEFVIPARIVSELGNGSTEAGARKLYAMMDRIQKARKKSTGKNKVAHNSRSEKYLPA
jgi:hypothetical protein